MKDRKKFGYTPEVFIDELNESAVTAEALDKAGYGNVQNNYSIDIATNNKIYDYLISKRDAADYERKKFWNIAKRKAEEDGSSNVEKYINSTYYRAAGAEDAIRGIIREMIDIL